MGIEITPQHRNNTLTSKQHIDIKITFRYRKKNMSTLIIFNPSKVEQPLRDMELQEQ